MNQARRASLRASCARVGPAGLAASALASAAATLVRRTEIPPSSPPAVEAGILQPCDRSQFSDGRVRDQGTKKAKEGRLLQ